MKPAEQAETERKVIVREPARVWAGFAIPTPHRGRKGP
jgi:hypothetical protein